MTAPADRTRRAVELWLHALPAPLFDLRTIAADGVGRPSMRRVPAEGLLAILPWVRAQNAAGRYVYCRPMAARHVLVDDLTWHALDAIRRDHHLAAVVETSPGSHQVWLTLSDGDVAPGLGGAVARLLAARYGGDAGAASGVQVGRLPGTTNRKAERRRSDGQHPFVLLRHAARATDPRGAALLEEAGRPTTSGKKCVADFPHDPRAGALCPRSPEQEAVEATRRVRAMLPPGAALDASRVDYAIARRLLARGASHAYVGAVIAASGHAAERSPAAVADYVTRTLAAAGAPALPQLGSERPSPWGHVGATKHASHGGAA